jgi:multidrug transporter EmrE-like cation transporter
VQKVDPIGYVTAIGTMFSLVVVLMLIRKAKAASSIQLMSSFSMWGFLIGTILVLIEDQKLHGPVIPLILVIVFALPGHLILNYAARLAPVGPASIMRSSDIIFAYIWQVMFFQERINPWTILGIVAVLLSVWFIALSKMKCCKRDKINFETLEESDSNDLELGKLSPMPSFSEDGRPIRTMSKSRSYDPFDNYTPELVVSSAQENSDVELGSDPNDMDDTQI